MELERAKRLADDLVVKLTPSCDRIEIAGSIRRGKAEVKDIEIVAEPVFEDPLTLFGDAPVTRSLLDKALNVMWYHGEFVFIKNGPKYKQLQLVVGGGPTIKVDLFLVTPPAQWGVIQVIRTGPAEFSRWMVTPLSKGGALPDGYAVKNGCVVHHGQVQCAQPMPEEQDFFHFCGLMWMEPKERRPKWGNLSG
jgi:DNA polymerase/3'-5' exonuclease PolX